MLDEHECRVMLGTLNSIEVKGRKNLSMLLGCIEFLQKKIDEAVEAQNAENHA